MKQVIFVGSTAYSGSTFLDLTLAHDEAGFSCGEVVAFFYPTKPHHSNPNCAAFPRCGCVSNHCKVWQNLKAHGPKNLYQSIFDQFPEISFIVDSSKDPLWIAEQNERLAKADISVKNVVIWKTPLEIAASFAKRDQENKWERAWVNYYRIFVTLLGDNWRSVRYDDFVKNPSTLEQLCRTLDIPNFSGKEKYWNKYPYNSLFGNHSAKIHLSDDIENYTDVSNEKDEVTSNSSHRSIYHREVSDDKLSSRVEQRIRKSKYIEAIYDRLEKADIKNEMPQPAGEMAAIKSARISILLRKYKRALATTRYRLNL